MVLFCQTQFRVVPSMAPTTRSARFSIDAQTLNFKATSSSRAITADTSRCKAVSFQEESSLRVNNSKAYEKADGELQRIVRIQPRKERNISQVDPEETMAPDLEDFCSSGVSQVDPVFSQSEVLTIRTNLLSWYDRNHRDLPWRINSYSCLRSPVSSDEPDEHRKEASSIEAKEEASHLGVSRADSVHAAVHQNSTSSMFFVLFL